MRRSPIAFPDRLGKLRVFAWLALGLCCGCGEATPPEEPRGAADAARNTQPADTAARETWDALYIQGHKVGHRRLVVSEVPHEGKRLVRTEETSLLRLARFNVPIEQEFRASTLTELTGEPLDLEYQVQMGAAPTRFRGTVRDGRLEGEWDRGGPVEKRQIEWPPDTRGYFAMEKSLLAEPMRAGETRTLQALQPLFDQVAKITLVAREEEKTQVLSGTFRLLRIDTTMQLPDAAQPIETVLWCDPQGEVVKAVTSIGGLSLESFRASREIALASAEAADLDLGFETVVKLDGALPGGHASRQIAYEVTLDGGEPAKLFASCPTQQVEATGEHTARITVHSLRPGEKQAGSAAGDARQPVDEDLKPNQLIESDDAIIAKMAEKAAGDETDPWRAAVRLERFVHDTIVEKDYSQAFASAAEVAKTRKGDCTEHAMLLAALCRARGIPARAAIGLVYSDTVQGFAYHMWNEVWTGEAWIPLDATLGKGGIGAAHLKVSDSNLGGASAYSCLLPVLQVIGRLKIQVVAPQ